MRITEAEINSSTRKFLLENKYQFLSTKNNGEKFYYKIDNNSTPYYKQPDCICYKENIVIVWEEKIKYVDLFKPNNKGFSDIDKLNSLFSKYELKNEFLLSVSDVLDIPFNEILLFGGFNSLDKKTKTDKIIPEKFIHLSTHIVGNDSIITLKNCPLQVEKTIDKRVINHCL